VLVEGRPHVALPTAAPRARSWSEILRAHAAGGEGA
jgi:hypothetical protein